MTFQVLAVCTGNVCRSPIVELLLTSLLADVGEVKVQSAGTGALVGHGVPEPAHRLATTYNIDTSGHRARLINEELIRQSSLVIAMAREHRKYVVEAVPSAMKRVFTLRELAQIAEVAGPQLPATIKNSGVSTPEEAMRIAVTLATSVRGTMTRPQNAQDLDVVDPYGRSDQVYGAAFATLVPATMHVAEYLRAAASWTE